MVAVRIRALRSSIAALVAWGLLLTGLSHAITIRVPQDYAKIQVALQWATHGDVIVVSPGIYLENINFLGKNVVLRSTNPTSSAIVATTIIDGNRQWSVVIFNGSETSSCTLSGFTIRNGAGDGGYGGGIYGGNAKARIEHNVITNNSAGSGYGAGGGGLYGCGGTIQNNVIANNSTSGGYGAGGGLYGCNGTIQNNVIANNSASGVGRYGYGYGGGLYGCNGTIQNNIITGNSASGDYGTGGGGLCYCGGTIRNNTIYGNLAWTEGGGLYKCSGVIVNCIIRGNTAPNGAQMCGSAVPSYSCIQGYTVGGQGNIGSDPRFRSLTDFHLQSRSPCIDAGTNLNCPAFDKDGRRRPMDGDGDGRAVVDMGAYEYPTVPRTAIRSLVWGLYR